MFVVRVTNDKQNEQFEHTGVLEFGRAPQRADTRRCQLDDLYVSRDHLRVEELPDGRIRLENLSVSRPVFLPDGADIPLGGTRSLALPMQLTLGRTQIQLEQLPTREPEKPAPPLAAPTHQPQTGSHSTAEIEFKETDTPFSPDYAFQSLVEPSANRLHRPERRALGEQGGDTCNPETLTHWLETVLDLQQAAAGSAEFYRQTAEALVKLIGLDLGLVLLRRQDRWTVAGTSAVDDTVSIHYSRTLLDHVATTRTTIYQDISAWQVSAVSLANVEAVVVSPIFGVHEDVVGVLYGTRNKTALLRGGVQPLEAQLVQLLAATAGAHLVRSTALRTRVQFEQFFTPELVQELERNPDLLEGRNQDVTVLFSDLRGFTTLSQRLGPQNTCRLLRDVMERLSERIVEFGGVIVDYAGDGILAMWNAPTPQADHAVRACDAALAMLGEVPGLNDKWRHLADGTLELGVGVNTGPVQVGNTGSSRKFKYGPHGHTVNLASRVQDATKKLCLPVLITAATRDLLPPTHATRRLGRVRLPGVHESVVLYELHGRSAPLEWRTWRDTYEKALQEYESAQWARACQTLVPLLQYFEKAEHHDAPTLKLLRRAGECLESRPEPFDPIIEVTTK
jgi:adenylate cyclase